MKRRISGGLAVLVMLLTSCANRSGPTGLAPQEAEKLASREDVIILDVRPQESFQYNRIEHAVSLPHNEIREQARSVLLDGNQTILVYCQTGDRGFDAARTLVDLGYTGVHYLVGGLDGWRGPIVVSQWRIEFNYFGEIPQDRRDPFSFTTMQSLHPGMEAFTFTLSGYTQTQYFLNTTGKRFYPSWPINIVRAISIKNAEGVTLQVITGLETSHEVALEDNLFGLAFKDWNFDGYMDMFLARFRGGTAGNEPSYFWLWNPDLKQFVQNDDLMSMSNWGFPAIDRTANQIVASGRGGRVAYFSWYEYSNGRFTRVRSETVYLW